MTSLLNCATIITNQREITEIYTYYRTGINSFFKKMLYFIGLGLGDAKDITVKGLEIVKSAKKVFLEHYTSILSCGKGELEEFYGRNDLILADRDLVESGADEILEDAKV